MKNAFLVSDDDLRSLRNGEPWSIELQGQAVFMHESVLKLLMQSQTQQHQPRSNLVPNVNGAYDAKGRSLTCDQPACPRNLADRAFATYAARQMHRAQTHSIPGDYADKHKAYPRRISTTPKLPLPPPSSYKNSPSYNYKEFDAQGICGLDDEGGALCPYKSKNLRSLHFHRSVNHGVRGINWGKTHKTRNKFKGKRGVGRPNKKGVSDR